MLDMGPMQRLPRFFNAFRQLADSRSASDSNRHSRLTRFFDDLRQLQNSLDRKNLEEFLAEYGKRAGKVRSQGEFINVWEVAGLKRGEVRNVAVLAWLFDENGSHGYGSLIFRNFLERILCPISSLKRYTLSTEVYPLGNAENRVDILIDGSDFLIFIEIKIDAPEDDGQIARYLALAREKAKAAAKADRYAVIFLSPDGSQKRVPNLFVATWTDVAETIDVVAGQRDHFGGRLLTQFAQHVRRF